MSWIRSLQNISQMPLLKTTMSPESICPEQFKFQNSASVMLLLPAAVYEQGLNRKYLQSVAV